MQQEGGGAGRLPARMEDGGDQSTREGALTGSHPRRLSGKAGER